MEIINFQGTVSKFNSKRKLIYIPQCISETLEKYHAQKIRIRLETLDEDLK